MISETLTASTIKSQNKATRIAMLFQGAGHYWQPILSEFTSLFPQTTIFTPSWPGFLPGFENSIEVIQVGKVKIVSKDKSAKGYSHSFSYLSPRIIIHLLKYQPEVVFSTAFSVWTLLASIFKIIFRWRTVVVFDGSTPGVDRLDSRLRFLVRRLIVSLTDAFITNTDAGKEYLTKVLRVDESRVFVRPYLIPHPKTYAQNSLDLKLDGAKLQRPIFICVGKLIPRKGLLELLKACYLLQAQGYEDYSLLLIGKGWQRQELEEFIKTHNLTEQVQFLGNVEYEQMGNYYQQADIFVFPTLEDVWGLVTIEAMMFGKPILCSKWAGSAEIVEEGKNGYIFDPHTPEKLAELMSQFIDRPDLINKMGEKSQQIMTNHQPEAVSQFMAEVVNFVEQKYS
ncbi:glycosyltransferase family 4 protein [Pleurocapsa sp. PCC 7319]|uniref:glycosyltransferase family 4 protein n=1 Tax=Pleurocapsa sp. PCC 7319 TaxID=118161 RepID=UPI0003454A48|nr:glycosyltransferase family 4 protein [Pleurocapsa sp. PCC 7319]